MRAPASANQRKTGKIVPGFQFGCFSTARIESAPVSRSTEQHHQGLFSPYTVPRPSGGASNQAVDGCGPLDSMSACRPSAR